MECKNRNHASRQAGVPFFIKIETSPFFLLVLCFAACSSVNHNVKQANSFVFQAGVEKYLIGETEDAYNLLKQAVKVDSGNDEMKRFFVKIISEMAVNEVINGNYKNAAALLEEALKVYPTKELREMLSRALILRNEGLGGMKEERSAAENRNREMMGKFFNEGTALYQKGEFKKAIAAWEKVLAIDPAHEPSKDVIKKARAQLKKKKEK